MRVKGSWKKIFRWQQKSGWCGPAVIQMALAAGHIRRSQKEISKGVLLPWWGTTHDAIYAYLSHFFRKLNFKSDSKVSDIRVHLAKGHIVIVNWWDNIDPEDADGHYCLVLQVEDSQLSLADPSVNRGIWKIEIREFNKRWYDYLDEHGKKWIDGWMLWLDPTSRI